VFYMDLGEVGGALRAELRAILLVKRSYLALMGEGVCFF